jgi:selenide,water dikinase
LAHDDVLVGTETSDDAGAVRMADGQALLATVDIITPLVDDPVAFGRIAAANSVSDIYAMGGRPILALSIACFPVDAWPLETLRAMLQGGIETLGADGVPVVGGHSISDPEMKLGYAVVGVARADRLWRNSGARPGDRLLLTKRIGTGILSAAARAGETGPWWDAAVAQMARTQRDVARVLEGCEVSAVTDVTGFGLAGHAAEMARGSAVTIELDAHAVPLLDGVRDALARGHRTRGEAPNERYASPWRVAPAIPRDLVAIFLDPQTSGGLLVAAPGDDAEQSLRRAGAYVQPIGRVLEREDVPLVIR